MRAELNDAALILVDLQNDFCPGGTLAVSEGDQIVPTINRLMSKFPLVISTQDWHPANHISFKERGGPWPPHCVQGTRGAELHPDLRTDRIAHYFRKASAVDKDDYSEFAGTDDKGRTLEEVLDKHQVKKLYIVGLATDYCVLETVLDGLKLGFDVYAVTDAMRAVNASPGDGDAALQKMAASGAHLITSTEVFRLTESTANAG